jgi:peptidoglycan/LPS O-acetylase OafA/YrhL
MAISQPISITPRPKQLEYRPAIDGLRAVAVLAVFFFHLDRGRLPGGFVGVDIFFVISGYLITSIIVKDCDQGRFRFGRFYQRRIARLLVAFFAMSLATLIGAIFFYSGQDSASAGASLAAAAASVANFKFLFQGNYFVLSPDAQPYLHCWSLSVEEQFYLLFPAVFLLLYRAARPHITRVLAALWVVSLLLCVGLTYSNPSWAFYLLPTRAWELLTGGILATLHNQPAEERKQSGSSGYVQLLGLALIAVSLFVISESRFSPGIWQRCRCWARRSSWRVCTILTPPWSICFPGDRWSQSGALLTLSTSGTGRSSRWWTITSIRRHRPFAWH